MGDHGKNPLKEWTSAQKSQYFFSTAGQSYEMKLYYCLIPCNV